MIKLATGALLLCANSLAINSGYYIIAVFTAVIILAMIDN